MIIFAALSGLIFGTGLLIAGMADPAKVLAFLDVAGLWNPSLAFVMMGAIAVAIVPFSMARVRQQSFLGAPMQLPTARHTDWRLLLGSGLFGMGWGIAGICPGPALVLLGTGATKGLVFVAAMLAGMTIFDKLESLRLSK
ncbi:MAG: DUF6691 family protein [Betaproteobacteria bacterium]